MEGLPKKTTDPNEFVISKKVDELESGLASIVEDKLESFKQEQASYKQKLICDVKIENPQFIFYENQFELWKTNSLVIDGLIYLKLDLEDNKTKIFSQLSDFRIRLNLFKKRKFEKQNSYLILSPTSIVLTGTIETQVNNVVTDDLLEAPIPSPVKQLFIIDIQDIYLNMCPPMLNTSLKMIDSVQRSIEKKFKSNELQLPDKEENFSHVKIESFFHPQSFTQSDFWFTPLSSISRSISLFSGLSSISMSESRYSVGKSSSTDIQNKSQVYKFLLKFLLSIF